MVVTVDEAYMPLTLTAPGISDEQFVGLCQQYEDYRVEYTAAGDLLVMPPTDPETSARNLEIEIQLGLWVRAHQQIGIATESSGGFKLPNGARLSPDAAWISRLRLKNRQTPEFIVELMSPADRRKAARAKMLEWIENGVLLGWLIDPAEQSVTIYRPGLEPETRTVIEQIAGEGPVDGFVLDLALVWRP